MTGDTCIAAGGLTIGFINPTVSEIVGEQPVDGTYYINLRLLHSLHFLFRTPAQLPSQRASSRFPPVSYILN